MTSVRESVHDLHDDSINLKEALTGLVEEYSFCEAALIYDMGYVLPGELKYSFIAIVKEALNNTAKHSNASWIQITAREHPGLYQLVIEDNGKEYETSVTQGLEGEGGGLGLQNMKDRIQALGGTVQIRNEKGFRIYITVPKKEDAA
jgi:signal transduction histidine kinase